MKTATVRIESVKSEEWGYLADALNLSPETKKKFFEFGEYACVEFDVDENLKIVGGRIVPVDEE